MHPPSVRTATFLLLSILTALHSPGAHARTGPIEDLSFGIHNTVSTDGRSIRGWHAGGYDGYQPEIYSDRVVLTPVHPGNKRGSLWSVQQCHEDEWTANVEFRATGHEHASGNMQIWYAKNGEETVGSASAYTVGKFDGLVIVIDQYADRGGSVRGFLNDGTKSFKDTHNHDHLAFGHCDLPYKNLGHFIHIYIRQTHTTFDVEVDGRMCFSYGHIKLPTGYNFGLTAASAEHPDSFEVRQFIVEGGASGKDSYDPHYDGYEHPDTMDHHYDPHHNFEARHWEDKTHDTPAGSIHGADAQFADLHDRITSLQHTMYDVLQGIETLKQHVNDDTQHLADAYLKPLERANEELKTQIRHVADDVSALKREVGTGDFKDAIHGLHAAYTDTHANVLARPAPQMGFYVFLIIAVQLALAGTYIIYKKRKDGGFKKFV